MPGQLRSQNPREQSRAAAQAVPLVKCCSHSYNAASQGRPRGNGESFVTLRPQLSMRHSRSAMEAFIGWERGTTAAYRSAQLTLRNDMRSRLPQHDKGARALAFHALCVASAFGSETVETLWRVFTH